MKTASVASRRHLVTLENPSGPPVRDTKGGLTQAYAPLSPPQAYAAIVPATARDLERVISGAVQSTASHLVTLPYHPAVTTKTRILFGDRILNVTGVQNREERNIELVLTCEEKVV